MATKKKTTISSVYQKLKSKETEFKKHLDEGRTEFKKQYEDIKQKIKELWELQQSRNGNNGEQPQGIPMARNGGNLPQYGQGGYDPYNGYGNNSFGYMTNKYDDGSGIPRLTNERDNEISGDNTQQYLKHYNGLYGEQELNLDEGYTPNKQYGVPTVKRNGGNIYEDGTANANPEATGGFDFMKMFNTVAPIIGGAMNGANQGTKLPTNYQAPGQTTSYRWGGNTRTVSRRMRNVDPDMYQEPDRSDEYLSKEQIEANNASGAYSGGNQNMNTIYNNTTWTPKGSKNSSLNKWGYMGPTEIDPNATNSPDADIVYPTERKAADAEALATTEGKEKNAMDYAGAAAQLAAPAYSAYLGMKDEDELATFDNPYKGAILNKLQPDYLDYNPQLAELRRQEQKTRKNIAGVSGGSAPTAAKLLLASDIVSNKAKAEAIRNTGLANIGIKNQTDAQIAQALDNFYGQEYGEKVRKQSFEKGQEAKKEDMVAQALRDVGEYDQARKIDEGTMEMNEETMKFLMLNYPEAFRGLEENDYLT